MSKGCLKGLIVLGVVCVFFIIATLKQAGAIKIMAVFVLPIIGIAGVAWKAIDKKDDTDNHIEKR